MVRRRGDTRRDILSAAEHLFQVKGFNGFSYQHIAQELGVRNAAVHYHFPSKGDLGLAMISRFREDFGWWRVQQEARSTTGSQRLEAFFGLDRRYSEQRKVCPLGVVGVEFAGMPPEMCREAHALVDDVLSYIEDALALGREDGTLSFDGELPAVALHVLAATQGGLQLGRLQGPRGFDTVLDGLRSVLRMAGPAERARVAG